MAKWPAMPHEMLVRRCRRRARSALTKADKSSKTSQNLLRNRALDKNAAKLDGTVRLAVRRLEYTPVPEEASPGGYVASCVGKACTGAVDELARGIRRRGRLGGMHSDQRPS